MCGQSFGKKEIQSITILSEKIVIDEGVHVGISFEEFLNRYPGANLILDEIDNSYEYFCVSASTNLYRAITSQYQSVVAK
ncbi:MAG: hypothetical protein KTR26_08415 [Flammeovirgaceae bacterium]|nr:hypothetical protein [Flammeovirgaceae bacterium]